MKTLRFPLASLPLLALAAAAPAQSSWVDFTDETLARLVGDPAAIADSLEKDMYAADLDLDGDMDLVVGRKTPFQFEGEETNVLFMNEGGVLVDRTTELIPSFHDVSNSRDIIAFDANGDVWPDLVEANTLYDHPRLWISQGEDGNGDFLGFTEDLAALATLSSVMVKYCSVDSSDIDGDGDQDLYFNDYRNISEDRILTNDGNGLFTDETATRMNASTAATLFVIDGEFADMNGDGAEDLVKVEDSTLPLRIIYNDGAGFFLEEQSLPTVRTHQALPADFNNDGRLDLYVVDSFQDYFFMNGGNDTNGHVIWTQVDVAQSPHTTGSGGNVFGDDLDQDGYIDVMVADVDAFEVTCERTFAVLRNMYGEVGADSLEDPNAGQRQPWNVSGVHDAVAFDIDGDGFKDIVQGTCTGLRVWMMTPFSLPGASYCVSSENSAGTEALTHAVGSASLADNDFRLVVEGGVPGQFGLFYYGPDQVQTPFGDGTRCVGGMTTRLQPSLTMGASGGLGARRVDFTQAPANAGPGEITAGSTWNFQFWYRDPLAGGAFFNLSDAIEVTFQP